MKTKTMGRGLVFGTALIMLAGCSDEPRPFVAPEPGGNQQANPRGVPLSGGTLAVTSTKVVLADPTADELWVRGLETLELLQRIELDEGSRPSRVVRGRNETVHVVLRGTAQILTLDLEADQQRRRDVCAEPRGVAAQEGQLYVTCLDGRLMVLPEEGEGQARIVQLEPDLRDVLATDDGIFVSRFRHAEVLHFETLEASPTRFVMPRFETQSPGPGAIFDARVAYRMVLGADGPVVVHQLQQTSAVRLGTTQAYYGSGPGSEPPVLTATSRPVTRQGEPTMDTRVWRPAVVPVDVAVSPDGVRTAVAAAGSRMVLESELEVDMPSPDVDAWTLGTDGLPVAVAYGDDGQLVVATQNPASVMVVVERQVRASVTFTPRTSPGVEWRVFHRASRSGGPLACASCHPEGGEDGHVWSIGSIGPRRTQTLRGGVLETQPLHWEGTLESFDDLMASTFVSQMGGTPTTHAFNQRLGQWLDHLPAPVPSSSDEALVAEGKVLFEDTTVGCAACHAGPKFTDNLNHHVGTTTRGGWRGFQTPGLIGLAHRAPYMHDGCASTLRARFDPRAVVIDEDGVRSCGGGDQHGVTSHLSPEQIDALVAYLESL